MTQKTSITTALLLAIIPGVAIYWLTAGLPDWLSKKPVAAPPATSLSFDGRVIDANMQRLLSGAAVSLELGAVTSADTTDSEGRYLFVMANAAPPVAAILKVSVQGYELYTLNIGPDVPEPLPDILLLPPAPALATEQGRGARKIPELLPAKRAAPAESPVLRPALMTSLAAGVPYTKRPLATAVRIAPPKVSR